MLIASAAKRRPVLAVLLACLALGGLALIRLAGPSSVIEDARRRCTALRLDMSEVEFDTVLGAPAAHRDKLYGQWVEDLGWYATRGPGMGDIAPGEKLYDWRQWQFEHKGRWSSEILFVGALLDGGRVICFWSNEHRDTAAAQWLRRAGRSLSIDTSFLPRNSSGPRQARKPSP